MEKADSTPTRESGHEYGMQTIIYIFASAWKDAGRIMRLIWVIGVASPMGMATISGRTGIEWLNTLAGIFPWYGWLFVSILFAQSVLLFSIGGRAKRLEEAQQRQLKVELGPPWLSMVAINDARPIDVKITNDSETQITDVKIVMMEVRDKKSGSFQPLNIQFSCGPINQRDHEVIRLGKYFNPEEDNGSEFVRLLFERDGRWANLYDMNELVFSVSAKDIARREYKMDLDCQVMDTGKENQKQRRFRRLGFPELVKENVTR